VKYEKTPLNGRNIGTSLFVVFSNSITWKN